MAINKVHKVMREFKEGELHSGSSKGPIVRSRDQAIAIAMSEAGKSRKKPRKDREKMVKLLSSKPKNNPHKSY